MALRKYAVGGLHGCLVSVTGVAFEERARICAMVQELGGLYSPELKPQCTHLIYEKETLEAQNNNDHHIHSNESLPIKVQYAFKWDIPVVEKTWIYACFERKILLEESDYLPPSISINSKLAMHDPSKSTINTGNCENLPIKLVDIREDTPQFLANCHIFLNGDSITTQRLAVLKRLVLAAGAVRYTDLDSSAQLTHIVIHNQLLPNSLKAFLEETSGTQIKLVHDSWLFDSFKEGKRLSEDEYEVIKRPVVPPSSQQAHKWKSAFNSANTSAIVTSNSSFLNANPNSSFINNRANEDEFLAGTPNIMESAAKILKGKSVFFAPDLAKVQKLNTKARKAGMSIVSHQDEADWCITPVVVLVDQFKRLTADRSAFDVRNVVWFEAALDSKTNLPSMSFAHPLTTTSLPIVHLTSLVISQSGFTGPEREFYAEAIKASGAQYTDSLSKANTHLLIAEPRTGSKFDFAKKWKIECIGIDWIKAQFSILNDAFPQVVKENVQPNSMPSTFSYNSQNLSQAKLMFHTAQPVPVKKMVEDGNGTTIESPHLLFKGLVFSSSQRLWHRRDELSSVIESLGGIFLWSFDRNCTHYLHQGNLVDEAFKEFKQARQWDKFIVSPWWILKCKESNIRLDESLFPHTYKDADSKTTPVEEVLSIEVASQPIITHNSLDWDAIMAERRAQEYLLRPGSKFFNNIEARGTDISNDFDVHRAHSLPSKPSMAKASDPAAHYDLVFSGYSSSVKAELVAMVSGFDCFKVSKESGSIVWDPKRTLLICNSLNFTEKIFSACASGCWILRKEFLIDMNKSVSLTTSLFEKYELGPAWNANERDAITGQAPKYWRQRLSVDASDRPFRGWRCALQVEPSRQGLYETVLRNGGAEIIDLQGSSSISPQTLKDLTHFFCVNSKSLSSDLRVHLRNDQIFTTKHITNVIFRLKDE